MGLVRSGGTAMPRFASVLFDLDGTLIDPGEGIAGTIQFVLNSLRAASPFDSAPPWYVGPPLTEILRRVLPAAAAWKNPVEDQQASGGERIIEPGARRPVMHLTA